MTTTTPPGPDEIEDWERQPHETAKAYAAFAIYREMENRTLPKTADTVGKSNALMRKWSSHHNWARRARAWDDLQDRIWTDQLQADRRHVAQRHGTAARSVLGKSLRRLAEINIATLSPGDVIRWMDFAIQLERNMYGMTNSDEHTDPPVQIIIDPRLLPTTATPTTTAGNDPTE